MGSQNVSNRARMEYNNALLGLLAAVKCNAVCKDISGIFGVRTEGEEDE